MKILIACEESQIVTTEFRKLGFEAYSCDIQDTSGDYPEWHIKDDVLKIMSSSWDMIIAFPPCTYLSNAGACRLFPGGKLDLERYEKGLKGKEFFMKFYNSNCKKIAIENPVPSKIYNLPKHSQQIEPYYFGHPYTKKTRLWLKGLPPLFPTDIVMPEASFITEIAKRDSKSRSKTFKGIAQAMAIQWGFYD